MTQTSPLHPQAPGIRAVYPLVGAALLLLLAPWPGRAAAAPPAPPVAAGDSSEISVTVVEIPVELTRGGEPVEGLGAADFEVLEKGRPLPIVSCEAIELRDPRTAPPVQKAAGAQTAAPPPQAARRHIFLLFDLSLSSPNRLAEGIAASRRMVASALDPSDLVGVGVFLPKGDLPILVQFTSDRAPVERALDTLAAVLAGKPPVRAAGEDDPLRALGADAGNLLAQRNRTQEVNFAAQMIADYGEAVVEALGDAATLERQNIDARRSGNVMALAEGFAGLADYLRPVEGRKYLNLFSEGFSSTLVYRPTEGPTDANLNGSSVLAKLEETLGSLKRLGWAINAANLATLRGGGLNGDGLFILADKTGGELIEGGNDLAPGLARALSHSAHSYLLTVQVDVPADGSYHPLEVRLRSSQSARGVRLVHRGGYFAPTRAARKVGTAGKADPLADAARLAAGRDERNDLGVRALAVPLRPVKEGGATRTAVLVEVPGGSLLAASGAPRLGLEVYGYALPADQAAALSDTAPDAAPADPKTYFAQLVALDPAKVGDRLRQGGVRVLGQVDLAPGQRLRVLVRERQSAAGAAGRWSALTVPVHLASADPWLDALFLTPTNDPWLLVRTQQASFDLHGQSVLPASQLTLHPGGEARVLLLGGALSQPGERVRGRILNGEGRSVEGGALDLVSVTPGENGEPDLVMGLLRAGTLPQGDYFLELRLSRDTGVVQATAVRSFRIE